MDGLNKSLTNMCQTIKSALAEATLEGKTNNSRKRKKNEKPAEAKRPRKEKVRPILITILPVYL